jgi:IS30 family transposase
MLSWCLARGPFPPALCGSGPQCRTGTAAGPQCQPVATLVERSTRYLLLVALPGGNHKADTVADALAAAVAHLPAHLAKSLTWDQGHEMAEHQRFTGQTGIQVYFCDPKSPWQRGSNENTNGLLRQYMPRRLDFRTLTQDDPDAIAPPR